MLHFKNKNGVDKGAIVVPCDLSKIDENDFDAALDKLQESYASPLHADDVVSMPMLMTTLDPALYQISNALNAVAGELISVVDKLPGH